MTELEQLRKRRELVVLAAELQRANVVTRLDRIQVNPARKLLGMAATAVSHPALITLGTAALRFAVRAYRKRRASSRVH